MYSADFLPQAVSSSEVRTLSPLSLQNFHRGWNLASSTELTAAEKVPKSWLAKLKTSTACLHHSSTNHCWGSTGAAEAAAIRAANFIFFFSLEENYCPLAKLKTSTA